MVKIGDPRFSSAGHPQKVIGENEENNKVILNRDFDQVQSSFRHGYYVGLENRNRFNDIMDEVQEISDPREKLDLLLEKLGDIESEGSSSADNLAKYLRSEISYISNTYNVKPRTFSLPKDIT